MDEGWDTGDVILSKRVPICESMTAGELHDILAEEGARLLIETLDLIEEGKAPAYGRTTRLRPMLQRYPRQSAVLTGV